MAYFANSTEGETLDNQCFDCQLGYGWNNPQQKELFGREPIPRPCPVALVQFSYNYDQCRPGNEKLREAMNLLIDEKGVCQVRKELCEARKAGEQ